MADLEMIDAFVHISQVKARYCRTLDSKDWDAFTSLFTEDFVLDVPQVETIRGRDKAIAFIRESIGDARTAHQIHLPEIDLNGDEANVVWAMNDRNTWDPPKNGIATLRGYGQYHERYVRVNGEWKIAAQRLVYLQLDLNQDMPS